MPSQLKYAYLLTMFACLSLYGCSKNQEKQPSATTKESSGWNRAAAQDKYKLIQTELQLADAEKLYAVLDFSKRNLSLKLKGAVVWSYPMKIAEKDSEEVEHFLERFLGDKQLLQRPVTRKHLFTAQELNPDSILKIVAEILNVDPELLQRDIPARFQLQWENNLILDIYTDIEGKPKSLIKNTIFEVAQTLNRPFGEAVLTIKMHPEEAVTFYRAINIGTPTLIYPPSF